MPGPVIVRDVPGEGEGDATAVCSWPRRLSKAVEHTGKGSAFIAAKAVEGSAETQAKAVPNFRQRLHQSQWNTQAKAVQRRCKGGAGPEEGLGVGLEVAAPDVLHDGRVLLHRDRTSSRGCGGNCKATTRGCDSSEGGLQLH